MYSSAEYGNSLERFRQVYKELEQLKKQGNSFVPKYTYDPRGNDKFFCDRLEIAEEMLQHVER